MGSGISLANLQKYSRTDQRRRNSGAARNFDWNQDRQLQVRPTKRRRTGNHPGSQNEDTGGRGEEAAATTSVTSTMSSRQRESDNLETLRNDLEEVERGLNERRGILFTGGWTSGAPSHRGGRALFDSIGSALGNIRERLHELTHRGRSDSTSSRTSETEATASTNRASGGASSAVASVNRSELVRHLSQRLDTAELSHSTRMPLNLLQSELSRRDLASELDSTSASAAASAASVSARDDREVATANENASNLSGNRRALLQRKPSALLASRNRSDLSEASIPEVTVALSPTNLSEASFASSRSLAASVRNSGSALPTLKEPVEEEGTEVSIEEYEKSLSEEELLLPDSARKLKHKRPSIMGSMKILGDDVIRQLHDLDTDGLEKVEEVGIEEGATPSPSIPVVEMYTWGSLEFSPCGSCDDDENDNGDGDDSTYRLFEGGGYAKVSSAPVRLPTDSRLGRADVVSMSASDTHCAFATASGRLMICGNNREGAVDPSRRDSISIPRPTHLEAGLTIHRIKKVSCGINHTAVVTESKSVLTWGFNGNGQLGHRNAGRNNTANFVYPKAFIMGNGGRKADNVVCCDGYTLVLTTRMEAYVCGGERTFEGGDPTRDNDDNAFFPMPQKNSVLCGLPLVGIASGLRHLVVWTAHGTAYAWGCNEAGQCGREYPRELKTPVPIGVPKSTQTPVSLNESNSDSLVSVSPLLKNWKVWEQGEPMSLASDVHVIDAACGKDHTVLVTNSGRLLVCGSNKNGQLGVTTRSDASASKVCPIDHPDSQRRFQCAEAGTNHTLLLDDSGIVWEMGNGDASIRQLSSMLNPGSQICAIAAGGTINFAISKSKSAEPPGATVPSMPELDDLMKAIQSEHASKKNSKASQSSQQESGTKNYLSSIEDLARATENLFRSPEVMNSLFVDPTEIDHVYEILINESPTKEIKQRIASSIERGMRMGLKSMVDSRLIYFESVRFLLLYLQCPLWRDAEPKKTDENKDESKIRFDVRGDLLFLLCETILGLPFEGYKAFLAWSAAVYGKELFVPLLVKPLVQQLNYRFINNITHGIPMIAGVLRWLHTVNERSDDSLARGQDFYCSGIEDMSMEALFEDLTTYHMATNSQRSSNFFLAAHPFLMAPGIKQKLLHVEHQMTMVEAAQTEGVSFDAETRQFKFEPYFVLAIDRKHLLPQTLQAVAKASTGELRKGLKVIFKGEDGVDAGGVTKEFFQLLCEQLFDVNTGMWTTNFGSHNETWFNSDCTWNGEGFYLVGVLCGLAVYNSVILDVHFPHAIYRKLLGLPLGLEDLIDEDVRKGLKSLLDYDGDDIEYVFCLNFEVSWMCLGQEQKKELKPGGSDIAVTSYNKEEYVRLYVKWLLVDSIAAQYDEFERGFNQVMKDSSLDIFLAEELELLVAGTPELDFSALELSAKYEGGFDKDSAVVKNIWKWIQSASLSTQEKFLKFCTGSNKGPIGGLGKMRFKIQRAGPNSQQLPTAHTCFNTLIIPDYGDDYEKLSDRLGRAVIECEGFGLQ